MKNRFFENIKNSVLGAVMGIPKKKVVDVWRGIKALGDGIFDEQTVKLLMMDLREVARDLHKQLSKIPSADCQPTPEDQQANRALAEFIDVADFIAHSDRNPLLCKMAVNISSRAELFYEALSEQNDEKLKRAQVIDDAYNGANIVLGMLVAADYLFSSTVDYETRIEHTKRVLDHQHDVALCMVSPLQGMTVKVQKNSEKRAFLSIESYDGAYRLYCCLIVVDADKRLPWMQDHTINLYQRFPVVVTLARDIDGVVKNTSAKIKNEMGATSDQRWPIIETYRDGEGVLRVREIGSIA